MGSNAHGQKWMDPMLELPSWLRNGAITVCGLIALFSPLLLWMAWSITMFWAVLAGGCGALLAIYFLIWSSPDETF
jgi:hypothetical protein